MNIVNDLRCNMVGHSGAVLNRFYSYLKDHHFLASMDTCSSETHELKYGVPQGSLLGPLLRFPSGELSSYNSHLSSPLPDHPLPFLLQQMITWIDADFYHYVASLL